MSKENKKRLVFLCTGVAMLIVFIVFTCILAAPGKNYTDEYKIHLELSKLHTIEEVEAYLTNNKISYEIKESTLVLDDYANIKYFISNDNSTGYLIPSDKLVLLSKLDAKDYEIVTVRKDVSDDGCIEHIFLARKGITYSRINGEYYIQTTWVLRLINTIAFMLFISIAVYLVLDYLNLYFKMKNKGNTQAPNNATTEYEPVGNQSNV